MWDFCNTPAVFCPCGLLFIIYYLFIYLKMHITDVHSYLITDIGPLHHVKDGLQLYEASQ